MKKLGSLAVVATHLRPAQGFGGVAESTSELILAWRRAGRSLRVAVSDGTRGAPLTRANFEAALGAPIDTYHASLAVRWGFGWLAPLTIARALLACDRAYISGIATWPTTWAALLARALGRPYVVALRGGLMAEHWDDIVQRRPLKAIFYRAFVFPSLRRAVRVHVASDLEARGAVDAAGPIATFVAPNAFAAPDIDTSAEVPRFDGGVRLLYLGRLSAEKGILGFARRFAAVRGPEDRLVIAGLADNPYGEAVIRLCAETDGLEHVGVLPRSAIPATLAQAHALVLPSGVDGPIQENFGNVVVEALIHGRPVLVTRGLAWDALEPSGVGLILERNLDNLGGVLERLRAWAGEGSVWSRSLAHGRANFSPATVAEAVWNVAFESLPDPVRAEP